MKHMKFILLLVSVLVICIGVGGYIQWAWEQGCTLCTSGSTPVYTPGTSEIAVTLPAGTSIRADATVGDAWLEIEYMLGGQCRTGIIRSDALAPRTP